MYIYEIPLFSSVSAIEQSPNHNNLAKQRICVVYL